MSKMNEIDIIVTEAKEMTDEGCYVNDVMDMMKKKYSIEDNTFYYIYKIMTTHAYGD